MDKKTIIIALVVVAIGVGGYFAWKKGIFGNKTTTA